MDRVSDNTPPVDLDPLDSDLADSHLDDADLGDPRQIAAALRRSQADLSLAVDAAHLGTFYCEWPLDKIVWNDTCKDHFFLPHDAEVDFDLFYSLIHPDDREHTRRAIERALAQRTQYNVEYRTMSPDGRT